MGSPDWPAFSIKDNANDMYTGSESNPVVAPLQDSLLARGLFCTGMVFYGGCVQFIIFFVAKSIKTEPSCAFSDKYPSGREQSSSISVAGNRNRDTNSSFV